MTLIEHPASLLLKSQRGDRWWDRPGRPLTAQVSGLAGLFPVPNLPEGILKNSEHFTKLTLKGIPAMFYSPYKGGIHAYLLFSFFLSPNVVDPAVHLERITQAEGSPQEKGWNIELGLPTGINFHWMSKKVVPPKDRRLATLSFRLSKANILSFLPDENPDGDYKWVLSLLQPKRLPACLRNFDDNYYQIWASL